jgi:murein DD-endopeptidase MepM/ murein hydrolase activator NlpD
MSEMYVGVGTRVDQGQVIGLVGSTGRSYGNHLHFEVKQNGQLRNPMNYISR